jgi:tetratricopeptide (TPR) repeat protein
MIKIIFGVIFAGALYYVLTPLRGRRVSWVDTEDPDDERMRELELTKKINLKALKDIEFELASGKINDEDYLELKEHYSRKVSRIMSLIEDLTGEEEEGTVEAHHGGRGKSDPEDNEDPDVDEEDLDDDDEELEEDEEELDDDEDWDEEEEDDDETFQSKGDDDEDEEWDEDDDEYEHRSLKGPILTVIALALAVGVGVALFQMGKRSAAPARVALAPAAPVPVAQAPTTPAPTTPAPATPAPVTPAPATPAPTTPAASQLSPYSEQAGLEHLVKYVQENPWNVTSHIILGEYYLDAGNTNVALAHFQSAEGIKPGDGRVLSNLGQTYRKLGNTDQAIEKFRAAADAEPESLEHLYQLGLVYGYDKRNLTQALALFEEILSRQPDENLRVTVDEELRKLGLSDG